MWRPIVLEALPAIRRLLPAGSSVLEVGYGDGLLTCWLAHELGWSIAGLDIEDATCREATRHAERFGLASRVAFMLVEPEQTWSHEGSYDGVFIKTVLYGSGDPDEYARRLDWVAGVLKPGGIFINFETGRANSFTQAYRRIRRREYTDLCLYTRAIERLYDERFEIIERRYYGGLSQFLAPVPGLYELGATMERALARRSADNCFVVSFVGRPKHHEARDAGERTR